MLTQIYEVTTAEEACAIAQIGIDHIGVLVGNGEFPREQPISVAAAIGRALPSGAKLSALFLTADLAAVATAVRQYRPAILHLGAAADLVAPADVAALKARFPGLPIMRSIPVTGPESLDIARSYDGIADFLLLDSHRAADRQIGALGVTHDWTISRRIVAAVRVPVILAGGLGPDNVADAVRIVRPAGVDSKTRTDRSGTHSKDLDRVRRFHRAAQAALA